MAEEQTEQVISEQSQEQQSANSSCREAPSGRRLLILSLLTLGVVFGDIGTSPLYALRLCFHGDNRVPPTAANVLGVLSLILWSLVIIISVKYLLYVMRADNRGEGGVLALMSLLLPERESEQGKHRRLVALGVFGAALLYGDGMITPAISVLSAVEGLEIAAPHPQTYVVPITVLILVALFTYQRHGTARVGAVFGPVMLVWFLSLAVLGVIGIVRRPEALVAVNPMYAVGFFLDNGWAGFLVLGAVFLVVTGGEALYADMGHFGRQPIRWAWFAFVLPSLLLNYFGQGALLLRNPTATSQPFYHLAPSWALYPLVVLATLATVIASQAVISGAFSLSRQAVLLGQFPRLRIVQTSGAEIGQIYIPSINWALMITAIALVVTFRKSNHLGAAYGVAVSTTMVITTLLAYAVAREWWQWKRLSALFVSLGFLSIDLVFFGANILKIWQAGWVPLLVGGLVYTLMTTWKRGRTLLVQRLSDDEQPLEALLEQIAKHPVVRVPGTAIFMTGQKQGTPLTLSYHLEHNKVLHEQVLLLTVVIKDVPRVWLSKRLEISKLSQGFSRIVIYFGFMESPNVPESLRLGNHFGLDVNPDAATFYVGRQTLIPTDKLPSMALWRQKLFAFLSRNATESIAFYQLPRERVIELGIRIEI